MPDAKQNRTPAPSQEGHAAGPACSAPDEALVNLPAKRIDDSPYSTGWNDCIAWVKQNAALSAPDEALIEEIAGLSHHKYWSGSFGITRIVTWAIREYIRRSAGKEGG